MKTTPVITAEAGDAARVIGTLVLAFGSDPMARWTFPDSHQFLSAFPQFIRAFGGGAFQHRSAFTIEDFAGASLWLPPGEQPDEQALMGIVESTVRAEQMPRIHSILEQMGQYHPTEPHWYLPVIGVDPMRQGQGLGSVMLRHALEHIDREHLPAYLESTNPANIPLYERHGFKLKGKIQVGNSPPMFPMYREAR